jgi:hypothetical protein
MIYELTLAISSGIASYLYTQLIGSWVTGDLK